MDKKTIYKTTTTIEATFNKEERLCSKKQIDLLFEKGSNSVVYPVKLIYLETEIEYVNPCQAMFVVPKRAFKKAHDRNKLKRRLREAYRLNKAPFYETLKTKNKKIILAFLYIGKKAEGYKEIELAVLKHLKTIQTKWKH